MPVLVQVIKVPIPCHASTMYTSYALYHTRYTVISIGGLKCNSYGEWGRSRFVDLYVYNVIWIATVSSRRLRRDHGQVNSACNNALVVIVLH
jgi:hypothetical protein